MTGIDYRQAGVDIDEGERAVELMKAAVRRTFDANVLSDLGSFGGLYRASFPDVSRPVLVGSTDGVGTKLRIASLAGDYTTVGRDLVNHCVNDILVQGARPVFFMDYIACGKLDSGVAASIVGGLSAACVENSCALLGGETAEMPGFYAPGDYDVAGTIVGVVDEDRILDGRSIRPGDAVIGLPSTGLHTNGYSLARRILFEAAGLGMSDCPPELGGGSVGQSLLAVHRSYLRPIRPLLDAGLVHGLCHVTGGGIPGNLCRILPEGCGAIIRETWPVPAVFRLIRDRGEVPAEEMRRAFNMGAGMLLVVSREDAEAVGGLLRASGEAHFGAGEIFDGAGIVYE
jgi:phosphoribosylformylglycinamidine cyclo-ligase